MPIAMPSALPSRAAASSITARACGIAALGTRNDVARIGNGNAGFLVIAR